MGVSLVKVININFDTLLNRQQNKDSNIPPSTNSYFNSTLHENSTDKLRIYHQNIRGLHNKVDELTTHWLNHFPHLLCITEHHLRDFEIGNIYINHYNLGAFYCRKSQKYGGVGIFIHDTLTYSNIDLNKYCNEFDLENFALKLKTSNKVFYILYIHRPPTSNFLNFLCLLESILLQLHSNTSNIIICDDLNINHPETSNYKTQLVSLLASFNLSTTVDFSIRITKIHPQTLIISLLIKQKIVIIILK